MRYGALDYEVEVSASVELDIDELYDSVCCEAADAYYDKEKNEVVESVTGIDFDKAEAQKLWDAAELGETVEIPLTVTEPEKDTEYVESKLFADDLGEPGGDDAGGQHAEPYNEHPACCAGHRRAGDRAGRAVLV